MLDKVNNIACMTWMFMGLDFVTMPNNPEQSYQASEVNGSEEPHE